MNIRYIREQINHLRKPAPYTPVITECKGALNITLGSTQILASLAMRCNQQYAIHAPRHVNIGREAIAQGAREIIPTLLVGGMVYSLHSYISCKQYD